MGPLSESQLKSLRAFFDRRSCFKKVEAEDAICGLHNVQLHTSEEFLNCDAPFLGTAVYLYCPVTGSSVLNSHGIRERVRTSVEL